MWEIAFTTTSPCILFYLDMRYLCLEKKILDFTKKDDVVTALSLLMSSDDDESITNSTRDRIQNAYSFNYPGLIEVLSGKYDLLNICYIMTPFIKNVHHHKHSS